MLHKLVLGMAIAMLLLATSSTANADAGRPFHVYTKPTLPEACIALYQPVHDVFGNTYGNWCYAAQAGVRVVWEGVGE